MKQKLNTIGIVFRYKFCFRNYNENLNNSTLERDEYNEIDDQFSENDIQDYEKPIHFPETNKSRKLLATAFDEVRIILSLIIILA